MAMFHDLRGFIEHLDREGQVVRVDEPLSTSFEIPAAIAQVNRVGRKVCLATNVKGYPGVHVVGGVLGTRERLALAMGTDGDVVQEYFSRRQQLVEPRVVEAGPVQEIVVDRDVDILKEVPVLIHHERDAGHYLTCAITVARDPETGMRGMGIHRVQVKGPDTVGILAGSPPVAECLAKAEARGSALEIAIFVGVDPLTYLASVVRAPGVDKFAIAGALMREPVELVKCKTVSLEVPARAEYVLEGYFVPGRREHEGPFGESTGYYLAYDSPVARITALTRRRDPIYQALMPFSGGEDQVLMGVAWEGEILRAMQSALPLVKGLHFKHVGLIACVQIEKEGDADATTVFERLLRLNPAVKVVVVVDKDVNPSDPDDVAWAIATRCRPGDDVTIQSDGVALRIDPSRTEGDRSGKIFIDATKPLGAVSDFQRIAVPPYAAARAREAVEGALRRSAGGSARAEGS